MFSPSMVARIAVLVSADRDFVPVAEFLQNEGLKVVHGCFPPKGSHLSQKCWGNLNITKMMPAFKRSIPTPAAKPLANRPWGGKR